MKVVSYQIQMSPERHAGVVGNGRSEMVHLGRQNVFTSSARTEYMRELILVHKRSVCYCNTHYQRVGHSLKSVITYGPVFAQAKLKVSPFPNETIPHLVSAALMSSSHGFSFTLNPEHSRFFRNTVLLLYASPNQTHHHQLAFRSSGVL